MSGIPILFRGDPSNRNDDDPAMWILVVMIAVVLLCCVGLLGYVVWHEATT